MPSPFPGMDPFLEDEKLWPAFQHQIVHCLYQILSPGLMERYRARVSQRHYVTEQALFTSVTREEHLEQFIEVRQRVDGRLVTLVEVVSPTNKTSSAGREAYLAKRREGKSQNCNLLEIDLILQGQPLLDYAREPDWDYAVTMTRATQPERYEIWTSTLAKRLPRFKLPLAADDRDIVVDLQAAFSRSFDQGGFCDKIDYEREPPTKVSAEQKIWIDGKLKELKVRL